MIQLDHSDVAKLIKDVESILNQAVQDRKEVISVYPSVDRQRDARITAFSKLIDVLRSVQLSLIFVSKHLMNKSWWHSVCKNPIPEGETKSYMDGFGRFVKFGLVHGTFSCVESSMRVFLCALDPGACSRGTAEFKSVYECLLKSKLSACPSDAIELLDLFRLVRNTIHNNGLHLGKHGKDKSINWKGTTYQFKHGHPVRFIPLDFIVAICDAVRSLLLVVVKDPNLTGITCEISDPGGPYRS
jgi:hypothetical protein